MDEQKKLLQGLWRKAWLQGEPLVVPCKTEANAVRIRFALYNAVRAVRTGKQQADNDLQQAVENCSVGFVSGDRAKLVIQKKVMTELMQTIAELVGDSPEVLKSDEDMAMERSQAVLMEKLSGGAPGLSPQDLGLPRSTPYYTRGGEK